MEQTLRDLAEIAQKAVPTVILLIILHFYLKGMLFGPLNKILKQRAELNEGARKAADNSLAAAESKAAEYDEKLRDARADVYRQQEDTRRSWLEDQAAQTVATKEQVAATVRQAREQIAADVNAARQSLTATSSSLADQITSSVLARTGSKQ